MSHRDRGIDLTRSIDALQRAGLMPPVVGLHVQGDPAGENEVLIVDVLAPYRDDIASKIAEALPDVQHELRFITLTDEGRRPAIDYSSSDAVAARTYGSLDL